MLINHLFAQKTVFSLEVFPPKTDLGQQKLLNSLSGIKGIHPDFISVTQGAGGSNNQSMLSLASQIQTDLQIPVLAHLPGLYRDQNDVRRFLADLDRYQIHNVLALRGDYQPGQTTPRVFPHAADLAKFIQQTGQFDITGACYPQKHPEAPDLITDTLNLKTKVENGVNHLITQMIFDNDQFYAFQERLRLAGINVPVEVGIMPCTNHRQIKRITELAGITMPKKFTAMMDRYQDCPEAMRAAGIAYAIDQIVDLVAHGVDGIHLYTMNNPEVAQQIWAATHTLFEANPAPRPQLNHA
ncbi:methylenetetrahydrofolate reductase [NAD(P)H] [Fructilactobacillus carniphilus]|uniref:Methylenetetrahydrofolate reductase n=1 Tax=Fructilactobacillus carniphilus TaxID=2940297 RepID=A0ABY5BY54_9LACO|nr:methylenetetrahydrofolate reductase [NAD(P)H] [Fructilactobacillus carniphilus]USS90303.1 methylenetetrahydrofolate reductase [NAD(P)H] [Fructilactobacillus carniphilus]